MEQTIIVGLLSFFLGLILGHRLTLQRDKRKEFNDIAKPIREKLFIERDNPSPNDSGIHAIDADLLQSAISPFHRTAFRIAWDSYCQAKKDTYQDSYGQPFYTNPENIVSHIDNVLSFTERQ